ncbi:MAG TPA: RNA polymerase sigma factor [Puia sp.]|nr:RNA polymerase sigma factor [Puia sp.]
MYNPFKNNNELLPNDDEHLVTLAIGGDKSALDLLIRRHQPWVFNLCVRMVGNHEDAADLTQETLVKAITSLGNFRGDSKFRTWLYRIVKNSSINFKAKKNKVSFSSFDQLANILEAAPNEELPDQQPYGADKNLLIKETKHRCMTGMLLCLDPEQRLTFILGELFGVTDVVGAEILDITKENFRQKLSRARKQLYNFMQEKCGLENKANPCRCAKKTKAFIDAGVVDPKTLRFSSAHQLSIAKVAEARQEQMETLMEENYKILYRQHPFLDGPDFTTKILEILSTVKSRNIFNLTDH